MKGQNGISSLKPINLIDVFSNKNYTEEPQEINFKRTQNIIKELKDFLKDTNKHFIELKDDTNKCLSDIQEHKCIPECNTKDSLGLETTIQWKYRNTGKKQAEIIIELENLIAHSQVEQMKQKTE